MAKKINEELFHLMRRILQEHAANWQRDLGGLTRPQYAVLRAVEQDPGIEQGHLITAAVSSKATLAEMLSRLEGRGLLYRTVDARDKRRRYVDLTDEGQQLLTQSLPAVRGVDELSLSKLGAAERAELVRLLQLMLDVKN